MIKAITFDLDGVYFPDGKAKFIENLENFGVSEDDARRVFLKSDEMNKLYKNGKMNDTEFWDWAVKEWNLECNPQDIIQLLVDSYSISSEVKEVISTIRGNGYLALACSNNFPARVNGLQNKFGFLEDFDAKVFSYEIGASKPDQKIFEALIERARVEPKTIVFADDNEDNLVGAKQLGINTFLYEGFDKFITKLDSLGVNINE